MAASMALMSSLVFSQSAVNASVVLKCLTLYMRWQVVNYHMQRAKECGMGGCRPPLEKAINRTNLKMVLDTRPLLVEKSHWEYTFVLQLENSLEQKVKIH